MLWLSHSGFITGKVFYFQYNLQYILPGMTLFFVGRHSLCPAHLLSIALANHRIHNIISVLRITLRRWSRSMMSALPSNMAFFGPMSDRSSIAILIAASCTMALHVSGVAVAATSTCLHFHANEGIFVPPVTRLPCLKFVNVG